MNTLKKSIVALVTAAYCALAPVSAKADWYSPECSSGDLQPKVQLVLDEYGGEMLVREDDQIIQVKYGLMTHSEAPREHALCDKIPSRDVFDYNGCLKTIVPFSNDPRKIIITPCSGAKEGPATELERFDPRDYVVDARDYHDMKELGKIRDSTLERYASQFSSAVASPAAEFWQSASGKEVTMYFRTCDSECEDIGRGIPRKACLEYFITKNDAPEAGSEANYRFEIRGRTENCVTGEEYECYPDTNPCIDIGFRVSTQKFPASKKIFQKAIDAFEAAYPEKAKPYPERDCETQPCG